ncbi:hypothetical protein D3C86_1333570 [compost metagenome]
MRRSLPVTAQLIEAFLSRAGWIATVPRRHDAASPVATIGVRENPPTQVECRLALVEVGVVALGIGLPQVHGGSGDRLTVQVGYASLQEHHRCDTVLAPVIHASLVLAQRSPRYIQRAVNRPWRTAGPARFGVPGIRQQIKKMFDTDSGDQQTCFVSGTQTVDVVHRPPELIVADLQILDHSGDFLQQT